ncbi:ABC transporter permease [Bacillus sp. FJAT-29790]|uniref:ABC transporter permease n=1 Tax=Bacillus sp. FJAT-29790 TaxID=1895002 RepID=UPI001C22CE77|nr:ABC transporter permease [Bacillus sp. FJAT-29790]MBU8881340.1 ABC transporter permease [Bacillus sp. FJAT-29790]
MDGIGSTITLSAARRKLKKEQNQILKRRFFSNYSMLIGITILVFLVLLGLVGPFLVGYSPYEMIVSNRLQAPNAQHILGTDNFGRDLLTRIIYGARASIGVGFSIAIITSIIGLTVGLYASFYKSLDQILMRICDGLMAIPGILLAIALMAALGPKVENVIIALSIVFTPYVARIVRSAALVVREQTYIEAMKAQGASSTRIIWLHVAPNVLSPLIVQATFIFADSIITEAALSFLGAGIPAPAPSWGNILYDGKLVIFNAWWMTVFPGLLIILSVIGLNSLGDGLRDIMDPHYKKIKKKKAKAKS